MFYKIIKNFAAKLSWDLSTQTPQVIEFSSVSLCPVGCKYCPQTLLKNSTNKNLNSKNLNFNNFKNYLKKIPNKNLKIMWTGYSEPLLNLDFPYMVEYANKLGIKQEISTTLVGHQSNFDYLCKSKAFLNITLHLPDNNGLMEDRILTVDQNYLNRLKKILDTLHKEHIPTIKVVCFGEDYHNKIKKVFNQNKFRYILSDFKVRSNLGSRSGAIKSFMPGIITGKIGQYFKYGSRIPVSKFYNLILKYLIPKTNIYYCSYQRLNQPVILGDGKMNICCNDYSLRGIIGDISKNNFKSIYKEWYEKNSNDFIKGNYEPCTDCEFYRKIKLNDIFVYYSSKIKIIFKNIINNLFL